MPIDAEEIRKGTNCQLYAAGIVRFFGYCIPDFYRSSEVYEDTRYTRPVDTTSESVQTGDIIGFWKQGETNPKRIHLGIIRYNASNHQIDILHASKKEGCVRATPLEEMIRLPEYERIACIKRGTHRLQELQNPHALRALGFWDIRRSYPCENP